LHNVVGCINTKDAEAATENAGSFVRRRSAPGESLSLPCVAVTCVLSPCLPDPNPPLAHPEPDRSRLTVAARRPPGRRLTQLTEINSKSVFLTPQSGQSQSCGTSSHRVPAAMPSSGQPSTSQ
jgi:hypothetical protein